MSQLSVREKEILRLLADDSSTSVAEISEMLDVSVVTIRSDFKSLADKGMIVRTRGGAFPAFHPNILERQKNRIEQKERIAKAAAVHVKDGDNIMIVAGTTTHLVAKYLWGKRDLHIVTNSTLIFPYARINPSIRLTVVGGEFRAAGEALLGPNATRGLEQFHADIAFLGTDGFSAEKGMTADVVEMAEIVKVAAHQSDKCMLLADSSKYGNSGFAHIMGLEQVDSLITDDDLDHQYCEDLIAVGVAVEKV